MIWEPFILALVLGFIVSAGLYFAYLWPSVEPVDDAPAHPPGLPAGPPPAEAVPPITAVTAASPEAPATDPPAAPAPATDDAASPAS